jgi:hypothetical protein
MNFAVHLNGFEDELRRIVRDEVSRASQTTSAWLNTKSAATYLDITEDALRGYVKRGEVKPSRSANGKLLFRREVLDEWARAGDPL